MSQPPYQPGDTQPGSWGPPPSPGGYQAPSYTRPSGVPQSPAHEYSADPHQEQQYGGAPYGAQPYGAQPYGAWQEPPYGYPGYGPYGEPPRRGNGMAVAGFVLSFFVGLLGLIFSSIGLRRSREPGRSGRGLAIAGLVISVLNILLGILIATHVNSAATSGASDTTNASASSSPAPAPGSETVADACHVILPALSGLQADLQSSSSPSDMVGKINKLADTIEQQGVASGDAGFTQDTAAMAGAYRTSVHNLESGGKPDVTAITRTAEQIGFDCAKAGVTP